ncbi:MAG: hypothetical protein ACLFWM_13795 [Actinomycetota bacterium]
MSTDQPSEPDRAEAAAGPGGISTSGEGLLTIGALLVVGVYVVFELLIGEYFQSWTVIVAAVFALVLPRVDRTASERIAPMGVLLKALGYLIVVTGLLEALNDIRFGQLDEGAEIIGALIAYAGYVLAFLGARGIKA